MTNPTTYSEDVLVDLLKKRDKQAFSYLYDNYAPALNGVILRLLEDTGLAEDVLQEVFVKIWNNIATYDAKKGRLFTWMVQLTRNLTIDTLRSKSFQKQTKIAGDENFVSHLSDNGKTAAQVDTIGLRKQLLLLKREYRILIELAYFNGYTQDEIAKQLNIPVGTVKTRLRSAMIELKTILQSD